MNWKKGRYPTEGAGTAEIVHILPSGRPVVVHEDGTESVHYPNGSPSRGWSEKYNLKPQREERVCYMYRSAIDGGVWCSDMPESKMQKRGQCIGSALLIEGVHVPGTEPQDAELPEPSNNLEAKRETLIKRLSAPAEPPQPDYYNGEWYDWNSDECPVPDAKGVDVWFITSGAYNKKPTDIIWRHVRQFRVLRGPQS